MINNTKKGFTLIELLVVIAIVGILATIIVSRISNVQQGIRDQKTIDVIRRAQDALELYAIDHGRYPIPQGSGVVGDFEYLARGGVWDRRNQLHQDLLPYGVNLQEEFEPLFSGRRNARRFVGFVYSTGTRINGLCGMGGSRPDYVMALVVNPGSFNPKTYAETGAPYRYCFTPDFK